MAREAIRVEDRPRKQAVSILAGDQLAAVQMPGQDQVVAAMAACLPDSRVMRAEDSNMPICVRGGIGAGDRDQPLPVRHARDAIMDPLAPAMHHGLTDAVNADPAVVIAANGKNRCDVAELADQVTHLAQLGGTIHQVAPQQHHIRMAASYGIQDLPAQCVGTPVPEVNVADIQKPARVVPRRQPLLADMQGSSQPDFQRSGRPWRSPG